MKSTLHPAHFQKSKISHKRLFVISTALVSIGLTAFAFRATTLQNTHTPGKPEKNITTGQPYKKTDSLFNDTQGDALKKYTLLPTTTYAQDLSYEIRSMYTRSVKKEILEHANTLQDVISGYPANWIAEYKTVEITATKNGKILKAISTNNILSDEQKSMLNYAELETDIEIKVKYVSRNAVTSRTENNTLLVSMTVTPDFEAEYIGGPKQLISYLKKNSISKLPESSSKQHYIGILFTVNEAGFISSAKLSHSSGDSATDALALESVYKMPKWNPAKNSNGITVKQDFELRIGDSKMGDGC